MRRVTRGESVTNSAALTERVKKERERMEEQVQAETKVNPIDKGRRTRRLFARLNNPNFHSPFRRSHKTGTTPHFEQWKREAEAKSILQRTRTVKLAHVQEGVDPKAAAAFALVTNRFPTLWDLSQAKREDLLALKGVGPATLNRIASFLGSKHVPLKWAE